MDYKVLYRKYRPDNFDNLVGQEHIKTILINSIINDKIAHAYIFTGPRGTGKTSTAKLFAKAINCTNSKNGIPCGECINCSNYSTTPDIIELDAASNNSVDDIREIIQNVDIAPTFGKYKIYIIDEVHMLTTQAWNAFLKTLEEPPHNVIFILATTDIQKVPITVLSRCQRFDFNRIDNDVIKNHLIKVCDLEHIEYDEESLFEIAYLSEGCMRDALSILDQLSKVADKITIDVLKTNYGTVSESEIDNLYSNIIYNDIDSLIESLKNIKQTGIDIKVFINKLLDNFILKAINMKKKNVSSNAFNQLKKIINRLNELINNLSSNSNGFLLLELELISFINDEDNMLSTREANEIISREIISKDSKINIKEMIKEDKNSQIYNVCDKFIDIRINNSFVNANKEHKSIMTDNFTKLESIINEKGLNEFKTLIKHVKVQVVGDAYALLLTNTESSKYIGNSKLYNFETLYNSEFNSNYKFIFITVKEWDNYMKNYNKEKVYELMNEDEYINQFGGSLELASNLFGNDNLNIE